jgi:hypothetical protein
MEHIEVAVVWTQLRGELPCQAGRVDPNIQASLMENRRKHRQVPDGKGPSNLRNFDDHKVKPRWQGYCVGLQASAVDNSHAQPNCCSSNAVAYTALQCVMRQKPNGRAEHVKMQLVKSSGSSYIRAHGGSLYCRWRDGHEESL